MDDKLDAADRLARPRRELGLVAALGGIALAVLVFARLAAEMREGETRGFDTAVMLALRVPGDLARPIGPAWLQLTMLDFTSLGGVSVLTLVTILATGFLFAGRRWGDAGLLLAATIGGALLNTVMKIGFARPRPELVAHLVQVQGLSFPSGHAMNSAVTYLTLGVMLARAVQGRRLKTYLLTCAVLLTLLVGGSRVYLGVHWPTDVLAGWTVGAAWAMLCWLVATFVQRRQAVVGA